MLEKVFKAYDVRAVYPDPLSLQVMYQVGYGLGCFLREESEKNGIVGEVANKVVIGQDARPSSPELYKALCQGVLDSGALVIDVGVVDTPFVVFAINELGCIGGAQITASHNPIHYNGVKISKIKGKPVGKGSGLEKVQQYASEFKGVYKERDFDVEKADLWQNYRKHVHQFFPKEGLKNHIKVVVDASNGMAGTMVPKVFSDVKNLEIIPLNFDNTIGYFTHEPNPLVDSNLDSLRDKVKSSGAHLGVCFDGDADRCAAIDEQGKTVGCDLHTAWLAPQLAGSGDAVIYDLRSSRVVREEIEKFGGVPVEGRVGHVFMKSALAKHQAPFGGELSGHFYFGNNFNADSGAIAFAVTVATLSNSSLRMSECINPLRRWSQSGEINFEVEDKKRAMESLVNVFGECKIHYLDGVTLEADSWWCNVRPSNTEPLLRLNLEARSSEEVEKMITQVSSYLGKRVDH